MGKLLDRINDWYIAARCWWRREGKDKVAAWLRAAVKAARLTLSNFFALLRINIRALWRRMFRKTKDLLVAKQAGPTPLLDYRSAKAMQRAHIKRSRRADRFYRELLSGGWDASLRRQAKHAAGGGRHA